MEPLIKAKFQIENDPVFEGYHNPKENWNGWECPMFDKTTAEAILRYADSQSPDNSFRWKYDSLADQFIIQPEGFDMYTIEGEIVDTEHGPIKLYPVGTSLWTWELAEEH